MDEEKVVEELRKRRKKDPSYGGGRILSAVYTQPLDVAVKAFDLFLDTNALDTHIFPQVAEMESEVISWLSNLLGCERADGYVSTGGTESNLVAVWTAKKRFPGKKELIVPVSAHYSIQKAADMMGLTVKKVPLDSDFRADVSEIESLIGKSTLGVVATAGTSAIGAVDPLEEINSLCGDIFFHVDAAFGGFVLPFLDKATKMDFSLENLDSLTLDPHKMGLVPIPSGIALFRDQSYLSKLSVSPTYLPVKTPTLVGSRSGGAVAATWAAIQHLGVEGYRRIVAECMENTRFLLAELRRLDVAVLGRPELNFVAIHPENPKDVWEKLVSLGWNLVFDSASESIRIVVMPHVTRQVLESFISDLEAVI